MPTVRPTVTARDSQVDPGTGDVITYSQSGSGLIVRVRANCESRQAFTAYCRDFGITAVELEVEHYLVVGSGRAIAHMVGVNPEREGFRGNPKRWVHSWWFAMDGAKPPTRGQGAGPKK